MVAILLLILALLVSQSILTSRRQHEEQAVVETYSVARVLESDLGNLVDKVKLALHTVATERERALARPREDDTADRTFIANVHANLPDALAIRVADAAGRVIYQAEFADAPVPGVEGQPYFVRLRDECLSGIVISQPHRDGPEGPTVVDIARRVEYADGRFAGAIIAPVAVERLAQLLAAGDVGSQGAVSLRGEGLALIARHPPVEASAGRAVAPDELCGSSWQRARSPGPSTPRPPWTAWSG